ncbi:general negative regulator of transcription subunit 5 [Cryptotrichosporon argae]
MALRKLQAEIDKTLKSVDQGVEVFEQTFDKLAHASNATQKDKLETDLKSQIKKLQRMRDQIKAWLGNSDIKDKSALLDHRKLIESQMERFKALEKEMKMKAFSKEGLIAAAKLDPAEKAKRDMVEWIGTTTDELARQIEQTEAEVEGLTAGKKKKSGTDRLAELEELNDRRNWHIGRLEIVQRMLENGQISTDQVDAIQEDVKYFVETNTEEDFDYDTGIYDELNLQDAEDEYAADYGHADETSNLDSASAADPADVAVVTKTPVKEDKRIDMAPTSPVSAKKPLKKTTMEIRAEPKPPVKEAVISPPVAAVPTPTKPAPLPPIRQRLTRRPKCPHKSCRPSTRPRVHGVPPPPGIVSPLAQAQLPTPSATPAAAEAVPAPPPGLALASAASPTNGTPTSAPAPPPGYAESSRPQGTLPPTAPVFGASAVPAPAAGSSTGAGERKDQTVLGGLMQSFDQAKELSERRAGNVGELQADLDHSLHNAPHVTDAEPPRYYRPQNPIQTPAYYPQTRLPVLEDKTIYSRLELDQLFYIFYYMTGTYEQWCAAQELKRQSWRFHKQYLTWFQRAHNPQAITEDYEQGGYFYFDWENAWCQRKKSDFRFEYRWLSDH